MFQNRNINTIVSKTSLLLMAAVLLSCAVFASAQMRNITTQQLVEDMGLGINLGNTFDAVIECDPVGNAPDQGCVDWLNSMETLETSWGSPAITRDMIKGYKNAGFKTVRVPVAWSNMMTGYPIANNTIPCDKGQCFSSASQLGSGNYTINPALMSRVKTVVDWILEENMYVILNIHWDGGWWSKFPTDSTESMRKFRRIWEQVGDQFKDYNDRVIFASLNEEGGWSSVWDMWGSTGSDMTAKARSYNILNAINQAFVTLIRSQSGNNPNRHLQIQGYNTNIDRTIDDMFKMPTDSRTPARLAVSVHYYDPFGFTHVGDNCCTDWAPLRMTWGTGADSIADYNQLNTEMNKMKTNFVDKGIPVIIGEYGYANWKTDLYKEREYVRRYTLAVTKAIYDRKMHPVLWDVQLKTDGTEYVYYYNRHTASFVDSDMVTGFKNIAGTTSITNNTINTKPAIARPSVALRGKTLNVSSPGGSDVNVKMIDVKGRVRATFKATGGSGSFSVDRMPAGRYLIEINGAGIKKAVSAVVLM